MIKQSKTYDCAPAAFTNACRARRIPLDSMALNLVLNPHPIHGSSEKDICRAAFLLEIDVEEISYSDPDEAYERCVACIVLGFPVIVCVEEWEHWATAIGMIGPNVLVADPWINSEGVVNCTKEELLNWWTNPYEENPYYGIIVRG